MSEEVAKELWRKGLDIPLISCLEKVGNRFGSEFVSNCIVAWQSPNRSVQLSVFRNKSEDKFADFTDRLIWCLENPDKANPTVIE